MTCPFVAEPPTVVHDVRWWQTCELDVPRVSVNVSWVEIRQADFVGKDATTLTGTSERKDDGVNLAGFASIHACR